MCKVKPWNASYSLKHYIILYINTFFFSTRPHIKIKDCTLSSGGIIVIHACKYYAMRYRSPSVLACLRD